MLAWGNWAKVWELVNEKRPRPEWTAWGEEVRAASKTFVRSWVEAVGSRTKGVYLHMAVEHLPVYVAEYGNLSNYSTHGMEHSHKLRKQFGPLGTNCKPFQRGKSQVMHIISLEYIAQQLDDTEMERDHAKDVEAKRRYALKKAAKYINMDAQRVEA